ncbi:MAG TPA: DUF6689 family protein [Thermoanaerobaculia bacterium]|nr:DUF6689 family protein [Thermoanaerobaculia bacterium]
MNSRTSLIGLALLIFLLPLPAAAEGIVGVVVEGNELRAEIALPGGIGADLTLTFEQQVGLTEANTGLEALLVNPLDPNLLSRLTQSVIPVGFPVLIRIEPPAEGGLSFSGPVRIALHTHNLPYLPGTLLRIYGAPLGEPFEDITEYVGSGSYRCRGTKGSFSEFLILTDLRPLSLTIREKLERLENRLEETEELIDPAVYDQLETLAGQIRSAYEGGNKNLAITRTNQFLALVVANSGTAIPNVWRSSRDLVNAAGLLRADAETLRFSLSLKTQLGLGIL